MVGRSGCPKAKRVSGRKHTCWKPCPPGCTEHHGKCPQFCEPGCTRHAKACPQRKGGWTFTRPKGNRRRTVPIPVQLIAPLRQHFADQAAGREAAGAAWQDWDLVWCEPDGRPIDPHDDWDQWKALLAEAGIAKNARLHDARHTSGTLLEMSRIASDATFRGKREDGAVTDGGHAQSTAASSSRARKRRSAPRVKAGLQQMPRCCSWFCCVR